MQEARDLRTRVYNTTSLNLTVVRFETSNKGVPGGPCSYAEHCGWVQYSAQHHHPVKSPERKVLGQHRR